MDILAVPPSIGLSTQVAPPPVALQAGQVVDALVLALIDADTVRLSLPGFIVDVKSAVPLQPGATVRLAVQSSPAGLELVVLGDAARPAAAAGQAGRAPAAPVAMPGPAAPEPAVITLRNAMVVGASALETGAASTPSPETAQAAPKPPAPAQIIADAVRVAASRQGGLAPLMADVAQVVTALSAPRPVLQAAQNLLALRVPLDENLAAADVQQALAQSGLFLEANLAPAPAAGGGPRLPAGPGLQNGPSIAAAGAGPANAAAARPANAAGAGQAQPTPLPAADLKAALLVFREVVKVWLDGTAPATPAAPASGGPDVPAAADPARQPLLPPAAAAPAKPAAPAATTSSPATTPAAVPPPYRGAPPAAQPAAAPSFSAAAPPADIAQKLIAETDAALAHHTLLQVASLPDQAQPQAHRADSQGPQWLFEIPFVTRQGTSIAQFEVSRDGKAVAADGRTIWRARFSLDVEPMGPLHVQVSLIGERTAVTFWAERPESAARLSENTGMLGEALRGAALEPGEIQCRVGAPAAPRPAAGRFLDRAS